MQPIPQALGKKVFPHQLLRFGVLAFNAAHVVAPGFSIVHIHAAKLRKRKTASRLRAEHVVSG
jgi:hypothetical protein